MSDVTRADIANLQRQIDGLRTTTKTPPMNPSIEGVSSFGPKNVRVYAGLKQALLIWDAPTGAVGYQRYDIFRSSNNVQFAKIATVQTTSYTDIPPLSTDGNGNPIDTTFFYKIQHTSVSGAYTSPVVEKLVPAVGAGDLKTATITESLIGNGAVSKAKLAVHSVSAEKIVAGAVSTEKLDANAVTAEKITANTAMIDKLIGTTGQIEYLTAGEATVSQAFIDALTGTTAEIETAFVTSLTVSDGFIERLTGQTASIDTVFVQSLTASEAFLDRLTGSTAFIDKLFSETAIIDEIQAIDLSADRITTGTLAAARIDVNDLAADTGFIGALTAQTAFVQDIQAINLSADRITVGTLDAARIGAGTISADKLSATDTFTIKLSATEGDIANWIIVSGILKSASSGARVELNSAKNRVSIFDATNEKVVVGYLDGLPKNDGGGTWGPDDYGNWARPGDRLVVDGDTDVIAGRYLIRHDASLVIEGDWNPQISEYREIARFGTLSGKKGVFFYENDSDNTYLVPSIQADNVGNIQIGRIDRGSDLLQSAYLEFPTGGESRQNGFRIVSAYSPDTIRRWIDAKTATDGMSIGAGRGASTTPNGMGSIDLGVGGVTLTSATKANVASLNYKLEEDTTSDYVTLKLATNGLYLTRYESGVESGVLEFNSMGLTAKGNAVFDNGTSTYVTVRGDDNGEAVIQLYGDSQGTGRVYVGQSSSYGGGILYNGDGSPDYAGSGPDYIALYRRSAGTSHWTARNRYANNDWEFRANVKAASFTEGGSALSSKYASISHSHPWSDITGTPSSYPPSSHTHDASEITGQDLTLSNRVIHAGDTNTYTQFHAQDQWRVVTGGSERLEVNNSHVTLTNSIRLRESPDRAGLLQTRPVANTAWAGYQILTYGGGTWSFMGNETQVGLYDDFSNKWMLRCNANAGVELHYNGVPRVQTTSVGVNLTGDVDVGNSLTVHAGLTVNAGLTVDGVDASTPPIGATYVQFPGESDPGSLWPGTSWTRLFSNEGVFFRTEGNYASSFGGGIQGDLFASHGHNLNHSQTVGGSGIGTYNPGSRSYTYTGIVKNNGGVETRPRNRTIRVWERTG